MAAFDYHVKHALSRMITAYVEVSVSHYPLTLTVNELYELCYPEGVRATVRAAAEHAATHNPTLYMPWDGPTSKGKLAFTLPHRAGGPVLPPRDTGYLYDMITSGTPLGNKVKTVADAVTEICYQWKCVEVAINTACDQANPQQADSIFPRLRDLMGRCLEEGYPTNDERPHLQQFLGKLKHWRAPTHDFTLSVGQASALRLANTVVGLALVVSPEASGQHGNVRVSWSP